MVQILNFSAYAYPFGGEIDLSWDYKGEYPIGGIVLIFKAPTEIEDQTILDYLNGNDKILEENKIQVFPEADMYRYMREASDYDVKPDKEYHYSLLVALFPEKKEDEEAPDPILSNIVKTKATGKELDVEISVVPAKQAVFELVEAITDNVSKRADRAKLDVYDEFPKVDAEKAFFTVTRATAETAARFWGNILADKIDAYRKGILDMEVINVTWYVINNGKVRDKITDIMRALRPLMNKHLKKRFQEGVVDVSINLMADEAFKEEGYRFYSSGMLITFILESAVEFEKQPQIAKDVFFDLNFDVNKQDNSKTSLEVNFDNE